MSNNWTVLFKGNRNVITYSSILDKNNNIYIVGYVEGGTSLSESSYILIGDKKYTRNTYNSAGFVVKINNGNVEWFKWIDGLLGQAVYSISIDKENNFVYLTGLINSNLNIDNVEYISPTKTKAGFITKISINGIVSWVKWIDGSNVDVGYSCVVDSKNNIIISGISYSNSIISLSAITPTRKSNITSSSIISTSSTSSTSNNLASYILKLDENGNYIWFKWIDGNKDDKIYYIVVDSFDNIYATGDSLSSTITIDDKKFIRENINKSIYLTKFNSNGENQWFNWISGNINDNLPILICDKFDYIYLCGNSQSPNIVINSIGYPRKNNDIKISLPFIIKFENDSISWFKWIESTTHVFGSSLQIDKQNYLYITGLSTAPTIQIDDIKINNESKNDNSYLIKMKYNGSIEWGTWIYNFDNFDNKISQINVINTLIDDNYNIYFNIVSNSNFIYFSGSKINSNESSINKYGILFKYNIKDIIYEKPIIYAYIISNKFYMYAFYGLLVIFIIFIIISLYLRYKK